MFLSSISAMWPTSKSVLILAFFGLQLGVIYCDYYDKILERAKENQIKWCVIGVEEYKKCSVFNKTVQRDIASFSSDFLHIDCINATSKEECMTLIEEEKATLTVLDAGEVFTGGRYFSIVPILQHLFSGNRMTYYSVAVVKKDQLKDVHNLRQLRGKKACFSGVGMLAGWVMPMYQLMRRGGLEVVDCNNHVKNAITYFGPSCAVNSLADKYNPIGDNSDKLCQLCVGKVPGGKCTNADPYAGFTGAFRCLLEAGDIAFLKHTTVREILSTKIDFPDVTSDQFELLCLDGSRRHIDDYANCNWGEVPSPAVVTSSAKSVKARRIYQKFLQRAVQLYGSPEGRFNRSSTTQSPNQGNFYSRDQFGRNDFGRDNFRNYSDRNEFGRDRDSFGRNEFGRDRDSFGRNEFGRDRDNLGRNEFGRDRDNLGRNDFGRDRDNLGRNEYGERDDGRVMPNPSVYSYDGVGNYGRTENPNLYATGQFNMFESVPRYGSQHNLLVEDYAEQLVALEESRQTYASYLGESLDVILSIRDCPVRVMTLCITSDPEMEKCLKMRTALKAQLLKPEMSCYKGHSHIHCMQAIRNGDADVAVLDAGDVYTGGLRYSLVPIIAEIYNLEKPEYYVVAVTKEEDPSTEITYLKGKNSCHGGINTAAGWVIPMAYLLSNGWMRSYGCNSMAAAAEFFSKSCIPGALSTEYNTGLPYDNMCHLCHGPSYMNCRRDASEDYYGHTGAFRCLVEGGGDVAFVKHTTVLENTDGKRREWWARNTLNEDYQLLCPDGTRSTLDRYRECNIGKASANAIVARGGDAYNHTEINAFINLFVYSQQFYGRKNQDDFNFAMFYSEPPYADLIFSDATTQLQIIPLAERWYSDYVGDDFLRAKRIVDCYASAHISLPSLSLIFLTLLCLIKF